MTIKKALDLDRINKAKNDILGSVEEINSFLEGVDLEVFKEDTEKIRATERSLIIIVEAVGSIAFHIGARHFSYAPSGIPDSIEYLVKKGVLNDDLGKRLVNMAKFRNILIHRYWKIENDKLFEYATEELEKDIGRFIESIENYIEKD